MQTAEESMATLSNNYPDAVDDIAIVQESVESITFDLAFIFEFGPSAVIKTGANDEIDNFNESAQAANNAKKGA